MMTGEDGKMKNLYLQWVYVYIVGQGDCGQFHFGLRFFSKTTKDDGLNDFKYLTFIPTEKYLTNFVLGIGSVR